MDRRAHLLRRGRLSRWPIIGGAVALMIVGGIGVAQIASAATEFSANFEDGSIST